MRRIDCVSRSALLSVFVVGLTPAIAQAHSGSSLGSRPVVELIFSRSEITAADGGSVCRADNTNIARLDTTVEPFLKHLGLAATGSVETAPTQQTANWCSHYGETVMPSWSQLQALGAEGWTFISHSADYPSTPAVWKALTPARQWAETCGSAQAIDAHGLRGGDAMYLWPNQTGQPGAVDVAVQQDYVERCFGTERVYGPGVTDGPRLASSPFDQSVGGMHGGSCNVGSASCWHVPNAISHYTTPSGIIARIRALAPGQVMTLQDYLLVTGTNPGYQNSADRWDCSSADPNLHWTNDIERYCYTDWQQVVSYLASSGIGITQPAAVAAAYGRTNYNDHAVPQP